MKADLDQTIKQMSNWNPVQCNYGGSQSADKKSISMQAAVAIQQFARDIGACTHNSGKSFQINSGVITRFKSDVQQLQTTVQSMERSAYSLKSKKDVKDALRFHKDFETKENQIRTILGKLQSNADPGLANDMAQVCSELDRILDRSKELGKALQSQYGSIESKKVKKDHLLQIYGGLRDLPVIGKALKVLEEFTKLDTGIQNRLQKQFDKTKVAFQNLKNLNSSIQIDKDKIEKNSSDLINQTTNAISQLQVALRELGKFKTSLTNLNEKSTEKIEGQIKKLEANLLDELEAISFKHELLSVAEGLSSATRYGFRENADLMQRLDALEVKTKDRANEGASAYINELKANAETRLLWANTSSSVDHANRMADKFLKEASPTEQNKDTVHSLMKALNSDSKCWIKYPDAMRRLYDFYSQRS